MTIHIDDILPVLLASKDANSRGADSIYFPVFEPISIRNIQFVGGNFGPSPNDRKPKYDYEGLTLTIETLTELDNSLLPTTNFLIDKAGTEKVIDLNLAIHHRWVINHVKDKFSKIAKWRMEHPAETTIMEQWPKFSLMPEGYIIGIVNQTALGKTQFKALWNKFFQDNAELSSWLTTTTEKTDESPKRTENHKNKKRIPPIGKKKPSR